MTLATSVLHLVDRPTAVFLPNLKRHSPGRAGDGLAGARATPHLVQIGGGSSVCCLLWQAKGG